MRDEQTGSWWSCNDGAAMSGELKGTVLPAHPFYQMTFGEFRRLHPDGEVQRWGDREAAIHSHRNPRHGHGTDYTVGSPGIEPFFLMTWTANGAEDLDLRLPENELIIGVNERDGLWVYPLEDVERHGGVVHHRYGDRPVVILSPTDSYTLSAWEATAEGRELTFDRVGSRFRDHQTGSTWRIDGLAEAGPLAGTRLRPLRWQTLEWHTWASVHPACQIWRTDRPALRDATDNAAFADVVRALDAGGWAVTQCNRLLHIWASIASTDALALRVGDDPLHLLAFADASFAADYVLLDQHAVQLGCFVLRSYPDRLFSDDAHSRPLRDAKVAWSPLLGDESFLAVLAGALEPHQAPAPGPQQGVGPLLERFAAAGYPVRTRGSRWNPGRNNDAGQCYEGQVAADALDGFRVVIDGDCFLVFRFATADQAQEYAKSEAHCTIVAGTIALRSDPPGQYLVPYPVMSWDAPIEQVKWSRLLDDAAFRAVCEEWDA